MHKRLLILGTRGVPNQYGGFETLAEQVALHLVQKGWRVTVYCPEVWERTAIYETMWGRVRRVHIPIKQQGTLGSLVFGFKAALHARTQPTMTLNFGYQHALFSLLQRLRGKTTLFHMGGMAYAAPELSTSKKMALLLSEKIAIWTGRHFIADHPIIAKSIAAQKSEQHVTLITNGALAITDASAQPVRDLGLEPGKYSTLIAQPSAERSTLEIIQGFSQTQRGHTLAVVGQFDDDNPYHQQVLASASNEVVFLGPIYNTPSLRALRYHSYAYVHGHQLGGTNPSLVEALAAGNPVIAHDNRFNRWVTGPDAALFFNDADSCAAQFSALLAQPDQALAMKKAARLRHAEAFSVETMVAAYEKMLTRYNPYQPDPEGWENYLD